MPIRMTAAQARNLRLKPVRQPRQATPLRGELVDYFEMWLPWPPSLNRYYRTVGGRMLVSREGRVYQRDVSLMCMGKGHLEGRLCFTLDVWPPDNRARDLDNLLKGLLDALQGCGTFQNDSQIDVLRVERRPVLDGGKCRVILWELAEEET